MPPFTPPCTSARATDCAGKRAFGNRVAARPKLAPDERFGIYDLQGLSYGRTGLLVADMRLLVPDPSGAPAPPVVPLNRHIRTASA